MKVTYTIKRSRVGKPIHYPDLEVMLAALRAILEDREASGLVGKVWLTVEGRKDATPTL